MRSNVLLVAGTGNGSLMGFLFHQLWSSIPFESEFILKNETGLTTLHTRLNWLRSFASLASFFRFNRHRGISAVLLQQIVCVNGWIDPIMGGQAVATTDFSLPPPATFLSVEEYRKHGAGVYTSRGKWALGAKKRHQNSPVPENNRNGRKIVLANRWNMKRIVKMVCTGSGLEPIW